jgi:hypothetical protein
VTSDPGSRLQTVPARRPDRGVATVVGVGALVVITFLAGLGLGSRLGSPSSSPFVSPSTQPFSGAEVSRELWTAYLNRNPVGDLGWGLCRLDQPVVCQPILAVAPFQVGDLLSEPVTGGEWAALAPTSIPAGSWLLAGPVAGYLQPSAVLMTLSDDGTQTLEGIRAQAVLGGVLWVDFGSLGLGRHVVWVHAYGLTNQPTGGTDAAGTVGWFFGLVVGDAQ